MLGRDWSSEFGAIREDVSEMIVFLMRLDAKVERILSHLGIDNGEEEEEADNHS